MPRFSTILSLIAVAATLAGVFLNPLAFLAAAVLFFVSLVRYYQEEDRRKQEVAV